MAPFFCSIAVANISENFRLQNNFEFFLAFIKNAFI